MTLAVCAKCGATKIGALTWCPACKFEPGGDPDNDDDLYSMILSDHYFPAERLEEFSKGMQAGLPRPKLSLVQEAEFRANHRASQAALNKSWFGRWLSKRK